MIDLPPFHTFSLSLPDDIFNQLLDATHLEYLDSSRRSAVLVDVSDQGVPLVRTTTAYKQPAQHFRPIHKHIREQIVATVGPLKFNNALCEVYDDNYRSMGYHSDQAQDLAGNSFIAIFSCYDQPTNLRLLQIKDKRTYITYSIPLPDQSVVLFSLDTNRYFMHKIILPRCNQSNHWLGLTFRLSKTMVNYDNGKAFFTNGNELTLATEAERHLLYQYRHAENNKIDYTYPPITFTLSASDLLPPI
jgi:hypothetical protein